MTATEVAPAGRRQVLFWSMLLSLVAFFPYAFNSFVSPRILILACGVALLIPTTRGFYTNATRVIMVVSALALISVVLVISTTAATSVSDPLIGTNVQRLMIVTPLMFAVGALLTRRPAAAATASRAYVAVATLTAVLAVVEWTRQDSIFGRREAFAAMMREGDARALLLSDHSLVLGSMLALAVPLVALFRRRTQFWVLPILAIGTWATGSRGPILLALVFGVLAMSPRLRGYLARHRGALVAIALGGLLVLVLFSQYVWTSSVLGSTGSDYSANYRGALYASLASFLTSTPFGYGLGTFPAGVWVIQSEAFGAKDLLTTLDSELVYSGFTFGWLGVIAVVVALLVCISAIGVDPIGGLTATLCSLMGFTLALHAWDGLGAIWVLLVGYATGLILRRRHSKGAVQSHADTARGAASARVV